MEISGNTICWSTVRVLLSATSPVAVPIQNLIVKNCVTHSFCNEQAIEILYKDDKKSYARITELYLEQLNKGASWADSMGKSLSHFFIPQLRKGLGRFSNAAWECQYFFNKALKKWKKGQYDKAYFYLGTAVHLVQDLCVPHHARGILLDGHQEYENWAEAYRNMYVANAGGIYLNDPSPVNWVNHNAMTAEKLYKYVCHGSSEENYDYATGILLPKAQLTTAGFIATFLERAMI